MLKVVAEAGDGRSALEKIEQLLPEVCVLDVDMPGMDGLEVARQIQRRRLPVGIIVLTIHRDEDLFQEALDLGVKGYIVKDSAVTDIVAGIKSAALGEAYISPLLSRFLLNRKERAESLARQRPGLESLTPMERRILRLIAHDLTSKEIAEQLFISYRTVETHRTNICRKLDLKGNLALVKFAVTHKSEV
jgi:DNA-binding NarL/FixJ family response regulator